METSTLVAEHQALSITEVNDEAFWWCCDVPAAWRGAFGAGAFRYGAEAHLILTDDLIRDALSADNRATKGSGNPEPKPTTRLMKTTPKTETNTKRIEPSRAARFRR